MKHLIAALAVTLALLAYHTEAHAACVTTTVFLPGGGFTICTQCCFAGNCTLICNP